MLTIMNKVVFVQKDVFAKPGVMALSAVLKSAGFDCRVVVADLERDVVRAVLKLGPDVVAFSITTGEYPFMKEVGTRLRENYEKPIICGGPHPTFYPDVIHDPYLDVLCQGEGDEAMLAFLQALQGGNPTENIPNLWVKKDGAIHKNDVRPLVAEMDQLPFLDRNLYKSYDLYNRRGYDLLYHNVIMTGRGCPKACSFCFCPTYNAMYRGKGLVVRRRSVPNIIRELKLMQRSDTVSFITIDDDSFTLAPQKWLDEFCDAYAREIAIPFKCNSPFAALNEETVRQLKRAGCFAVKMGLESGNDDIRNSLLNKNVSEECIIETAGLLRKHNIRFQTFNMVGNPGESLSMALQTYNLNRRIRPDFAWCSLLNPYPGTEIHQICEDLGYLEQHPDYADGNYSYFTDSALNLPDKQALFNLQKLLYVALVLRMPEGLLRFLVRLPLAPVYRLLYGIGMVWGLSRINKGSLLPTVKLSLLQFSRYNRTKETMSAAGT
jgi:anaerobic magnesium-protoporphyrin IX monomethyl ester cyclase